jgi:hypothetical protein
MYVTSNNKINRETKNTFIPSSRDHLESFKLESLVKDLSANAGLQKNRRRVKGTNIISTRKSFVLSK